MTRFPAPLVLDVPRLRSLAWWGDDLIDWLGGHRITLDGAITNLNLGRTFRFDSAIGYDDLGLLYEAAGTKGLLVRWNGELPKGPLIPRGVDNIREIDRSYYCAEDYTFPLCLFRLPDGRVALAHCPRDYNQLVIELVDGTPLTARDSRDEDFFHSRLQASPDGRWLLSNGWVWHPWNAVHVYDVARALADPAHLGGNGLELDLGAEWQWEVRAATFVGTRLVVAASDDVFALSVYDLERGRHQRLFRLAEAPGSRLAAWDDHHVVVLDHRPRLLSLETGAVVHTWTTMNAGNGVWQPWVDMDPPAPPWLACDPAGGRFAIASPIAADDGPWRLQVVRRDSPRRR